MNWIPRILQRHRDAVLRSGVTLGVAMTTLAWTSSGSDANAQQIKNIQHGGQSFTVVPASQASSLMSVPGVTAPLSDLDQAIAQVGCVGGNCGSTQYGAGQCGGGACNGQCGGNCGGSQGGLNCPTCDPYVYGRVEALMMRREGLSDFTRSRAFRLDEYDFEFAPRITFGTVPDCVSGMEVSFTGPLEWEMNSSLVGQPGTTTLGELIPANPLGSPLSEQIIGYTPLYDPEDITVGPPLVFNDSPSDPIALQTQRYESRYWSVEASKTSMAWDIAKLLFGGRYISYEEEYRYTASNGAAPIDNSYIFSETTNDMIGLQVGIDMFTPVCRNTSTYMRARAGGYWNLSEATTVVDDQTQRLYGMQDDDGHFAALFELSNGVHYQLGELLSVHGGTEVWYLAEVASAEDQIPSLVGARAPSRVISTGDDVLFVGFNFGATLKY